LIAFDGSVRFTGHGGVLDTTVANPQLRLIDDTTAVLLMDVYGTTQAGTPVDQRAVEFVELDLAGAVTIEDGTVTITDAATVLTPTGSEAFGTYESGEAFDPITIVFSVDAACPESAPADGDVTAAPDEPTSSTGDLAWLPWTLGGVALLAIIALVVVLVLRRRQA